MMKKTKNLLFLGGGVLALGVAGSAMVLTANLWVLSTTSTLLYPGNQVPGHSTAGIILGAKVYSNGGLSGMTKDRADTAIALYQQRKISKLLVSGDHGQKNYDEVNTIKDYLLSKGIPASDIFLDHAGFDTYDSMYRAKKIFQVDSAVVVTQEFHLPRAVFLAREMGITAVGAKADIQNYGHMERVLVREWIARVKAVADVFLKSKPKYLGEEIPITGESQKSWDTLQ